jgi:hypothetical protein
MDMARRDEERRISSEDTMPVLKGGWCKNKNAGRVGEIRCPVATAPLVARTAFTLADAWRGN